MFKQTLLALGLALASCSTFAASYVMRAPAPGIKPTPAASPAATASTTQNIVAAGSSRTWSDGTLAASCNAYLNPPSGYQYSGDTGDGTYRINANGTAQDVYCDMTTDSGGWTLVAHAVFQNTPSSWATSSDVNLSSLSPSGAASAHMNDTTINAIKSSAFRVETTGAAVEKRFFKSSCDFSWSDGTKVTGACIVSYPDMSWSAAGSEQGGCSTTHRGLCDWSSDHLFIITADTRSYSWFTGNNGNTAYESGDGGFTGITGGSSYTMWVK